MSDVETPGPADDSPDENDSPDDQDDDELEPEGVVGDMLPEEPEPDGGQGRR